MTSPTPYTPAHKVRLVTAASLFDGHDAAINIMRRIMQATGAEVIHLGHNRSVQEIVDCAIQEDVQGIAITSYQGGHVEYFKYMHDLLKERGAGHIKIFGGGGGTILPDEIAELHAYGISRIYSPDDGREMGLQGMINDVIQQCDFANLNSIHPSMVDKMTARDHGLVGRIISIVENDPNLGKPFMAAVEGRQPKDRVIPILGITGTGGAGKSSLTDELVRRFLMDFEDKTIAVLSVDPSKRKTGGALLGDRIRMNAIFNSRVYMRSMATRQANIAMSQSVDEAVKVFRAAGFDLIIVETAGIGQSDSEITEVADVALYVMTPEYGAATQLEKIDMIDYADLIAINKFDKRGALDALRDVKKQYQRSRNLWTAKTEDMPVFGTIASQFNDPGTNQLYRSVMNTIADKTQAPLHSKFAASDEMSEKIYIIPPDRTRYLAEIAEENDRYEKWVKEQSQVATTVFNLEGTIAHLKTLDTSHAGGIDTLSGLRDDARRRLAAESQDILNGWEAKKKQYQGEFFTYEVRGKEIKVANFTESLSHTRVPKIALPRFRDYGEILRWSFRENVPGEFPYTAGVYPFKRTGEDPTRMFAGEGGPERTNKRFHYVSLDMPAARLSTAFDSVTLYGEDPDYRPDIYGKIGNSGVSIACLDDAKRLYSGFDLCKPTTSVSMTINGPAPMLLAFYMNTAIDQQCEKYIRANGLEDDVRQKIRQIYADRNVGLSIHKGASKITRIDVAEDGYQAFYKSGKGEYFWNLTDLGYLRFWADEPEKVVLIPQYRPVISQEYLAALNALGQAMVDVLDGEEIGIGESWWEITGFEVVQVNATLFDIRYRFMPFAGVREGERFLWHHEKTIASNETYRPIPVVPNLLPEGNDGLGLMLLGVTGDQVLPAEVYAKIKAEAMSTTRGTVQADILKEDQAQNTCIFSTEFALRMMGDIQQYFIDHNVRNFYSVSISGYHIAEAGANPISQLAFTIANGFTFVEYYLSRGMHIDEFAPNLSFFFSNGMDPEYAVIGRVARRIWAKAIKNKYGGNERSQMLKYHIQTSGRSLHAQEIAFNDIRTTLQALYAIYDNCNSLHTNAYDEAITTPTEESVRRAMAIQLIINKELGEAKNENPLQGSFIIEELTDLVEEAVMAEFRRITDRGGVLGAMETMYQRSKIQEESLYYEMQKHTGELPIIGVNTFLSAEGSPTIIPQEVIRSTVEEKESQIRDIQALQKRNAEDCKTALRALQMAAIKNENLFEALMQAGKVCSLGQMTRALYEVGGQYRRNM